MPQEVTGWGRCIFTPDKGSLREVFCGRANLSKRLRAKRFQVISVDHVAAKGVPVFRVDITNRNQREVLERLLNLDCILYVHFAPPCGTASAARHIQPGPPPLRSYSFPMGFPGLTFVQRTRVKTANFLFKWTVDTILQLDARGIAWSVENPASSLMWITDPFVGLLAFEHLVAFSFHTCMFQAKRKKDTAIWCSYHELRHHLERKCDGQHPHANWGRTQTGFATAEERAYNDAISASWAEAVHEYALSQGFHDLPATVTADQADVNLVTNKAILGCLPRGRKMLPFMSDFLQPRVHNIAGVTAVQHWRLENVSQLNAHCFRLVRSCLNSRMSWGVSMLTIWAYLHLH